MDHVDCTGPAVAPPLSHELIDISTRGLAVIDTVDVTARISCTQSTTRAHVSVNDIPQLPR